MERVCGEKALRDARDVVTLVWWHAQRGKRTQQLVPHTPQVPDGRFQLAKADRQRHQSPTELSPGALVHAEEIEQRLRIPMEIGARGEERALARTPLRQADHLAAAVEDLAGPPSGEAHEITELTRHGATGVRVESVLSQAAQCVRPPRADPFRCDRDVEQPQRIVPRYPGVQPELTGRLEIHSAAAATTPSQFDRASLQRERIRQLLPLRAAEHQGRPLHLTGQRQAPWFGAELLDVEERRERGQPQEAAARYGSHNGSTSDR